MPESLRVVDRPTGSSSANHQLYVALPPLSRTVSYPNILVLKILLFGNLPGSVFPRRATPIGGLVRKCLRECRERIIGVELPPSLRVFSPTSTL